MPPARQIKWTKLWGPLCFCIMSFNGLCDLVANAQAQASAGLEAKNILILHSHEANAPVFLGTDRGLLSALESGGISLARVTDELETEGVRIFQEAFQAMLAAIEERRRTAQRSLGPLSKKAARRVASLDEQGVPQRLWDGDPALWTSNGQRQSQWWHKQLTVFRVGAAQFLDLHQQLLLGLRLGFHGNSSING